MSILIHFKNIQSSSPSGLDKCDVFRAAALDTWYRIEFSRKRPGLKIHETTVTQNLVYELNLLNWQMYSRLGISIFESTDERANGDDLEIKVQDLSGGFITFATQSKILYHNLPLSKGGLKNLGDGRYPEMKHPKVNKKGSKNQIDLLLNYAKKKGYVPIYLLYNYVDTHFSLQQKCGVSFDEKQYGCSIISAQYLKKNYALPHNGNLPRNIKFSDLHPKVAKPWFVLSCCFHSMEVGGIIGELGGGEIDYQIKTESNGEVFDDPKWRRLIDPSQDSFRGFNFGLGRQEAKFNPMYRLVLSLPNEEQFRSE